MKALLIALLLGVSQAAFAGNVVTDPASTGANTITPNGSGITALTVNNTSSSSAGETAVYIENTGGDSLPALRVQSQDWDAVSGQSLNGVGGYFHSDYFYGVMGDSSNESSAYFSSNFSGNTKPTVLIQSIGGTANLLEIQDHPGAGNAVLMSVSSTGRAVLNNGAQLFTSGTRPACSSATRGLLWVAQGGAGVADVLQACMKDAAGNYAWVNK